MIGAAATSLKVPQAQTAQATTIPAPIRGMNASLSVAVDTQEYCLWAINMLPSEYGMRVRKGYREWQIGLTEEVRTIINYTGAGSLYLLLEDGGRILLESGDDLLNEAGSDFTSVEKIFAVCTDGIYDVSTVGEAPILRLTFATQSGDSGFGTHINYVSAAGADLIFYADEENGLFTYTAASDTWAQASGIQAVAGSVGTLDETDIVFVTQHKLRIWFVERYSNKAWYLGIRAVSGDATEFFFGSKFRHGGNLVGLYNWTVDGGTGRDDHLIAISREGDVIPWTGEDPSDAMTWTSTGVFYIGRIPTGRNVVAEYGGELFMLSSFGLTTLSDLLRGGNPEDPFRDQIGYRVARLLREDVRLYGTQQGWQLDFATAQGALVVTCPQRTDDTYRQYVYNLSTYGWGLWKGVPILSSETVDGFLMFGTKDGKIMRMDVGPDNVNLAGTTRTPISFFMLTSYMTLGAPALNKRVKLMRPTFVGTREPYFELNSYYDYSARVPLDVAAAADDDTGVWGTSQWNNAVWAGDDTYPFSGPRGGSGVGRSVAIALSGSSYEDSYLASIDVAWDVGGFL